MITYKLCKYFVRKKSGFTLIELMITIAIIGMLSTLLIVAVNPSRQFAKARDTQRQTDLYAILSAIYQYSSEHSGAWPDTDGNPVTSNFPTSATCIGTAAGCFNLAAAGISGETLVPVYMASLPFDPKTGVYPGNIGYTVYVDSNNRIHMNAVGEIQAAISITR
jgi:prepilin-type N-terminal cleavage/methylation domain-containing protein